MSVFVFLGPTLPQSEAKQVLDATYLPPVSQGDVYRVAQQHPRVIGIVDGFFDRVPAVWHKEILWAMSHGIHVFGSASMGALRAAELASFGMEGVGEIFEAYQSGVLEDDDEVALVHGDEESGYIASSEAMINIRYTVERAETLGIIDRRTRHALLKIAKSLYFSQRTYPTILAAALDGGLPEGEIEQLRRWLPSGRVDKKREDAITMLRAINRAISEGIELKRVRYVFEHTDMWNYIARTSRAPDQVV